MKQLINSKIILSIILVGIISSCSYFEPYKVPIMQGNIFEDKDLDKLEKGMTKTQVNFLFGSAVIMDPFHKNKRWDYFNSVRVGEITITERKLSIFFDENELVDSWVVEEPVKED